jgi:hypothetical protein
VPRSYTVPASVFATTPATWLEEGTIISTSSGSTTTSFYGSVATSSSTSENTNASPTRIDTDTYNVSTATNYFTISDSFSTHRPALSLTPLTYCSTDISAFSTQTTASFFQPEVTYLETNYATIDQRATTVTEVSTVTYKTTDENGAALYTESEATTTVTGNQTVTQFTTISEESSWVSSTAGASAGSAVDTTSTTYRGAVAASSLYTRQGTIAGTLTLQNTTTSSVSFTTATLATVNGCTTTLSTISTTGTTTQITAGASTGYNTTYEYLSTKTELLLWGTGSFPVLADTVWLMLSRNSSGYVNPINGSVFWYPLSKSFGDSSSGRLTDFLGSTTATSHRVVCPNVWSTNSAPANSYTYGTGTLTAAGYFFTYTSRLLGSTLLPEKTRTHFFNVTSSWSTTWYGGSTTQIKSTVGMSSLTIPYTVSEWTSRGVTIGNSASQGSITYESTWTSGTTRTATDTTTTTGNPSVISTSYTFTNSAEVTTTYSSVATGAALGRSLFTSSLVLFPRLSQRRRSPHAYAWYSRPPVGLVGFGGDFALGSSAHLPFYTDGLTSGEMPPSEVYTHTPGVAAGAFPAYSTKVGLIGHPVVTDPRFIGEGLSFLSTLASVQAATYVSRFTEYTTSSDTAGSTYDIVSAWLGTWTIEATSAITGTFITTEWATNVSIYPNDTQSAWFESGVIGGDNGFGTPWTVFVGKPFVSYTLRNADGNEVVDQVYASDDDAVTFEIPNGSVCSYEAEAGWYADWITGGYMTKTAPIWNLP